MTPMVECEGLVHIYKSDGLEVVALQGLDLAVLEGESIAIVGRSGSGKSTLMNILAGMETPSAGRVRVGDWDLTSLSQHQRDRYRREAVGYLWQHSVLNMTTELTADENVQVPMVAAHVPRRERRRRAEWLLDRLGLGERVGSRPSQLSGGEQQRLALGVALANQPRLLLADEPTAELDEDTALAILEDVRRIQREDRTTVIMVTHDTQVERFVDRVIRVRDGKTSTETRWVESAGSVAPDELVIMDRAGRLQLPPAHVRALGLAARVRVHLESDHIRIQPDQRDESRSPEPEGRRSDG
jgi:ABC-type lipoprotein export system ATPase subunit